MKIISFNFIAEILYMTINQPWSVNGPGLRPSTRITRGDSRCTSQSALRMTWSAKSAKVQQCKQHKQVEATKLQKAYTQGRRP